MTAMTSYLQKKLLDHTLGLVAYPKPSAIWLSLHTGDPTDAGSFDNEIPTLATGYGRVNIITLMNLTNATTGISSNSSVITMGPALVDWGTVTHVAFSDGPTSSDNMLMFGALTEVQTTPIGESVQFSPSQFVAEFQ